MPFGWIVHLDLIGSYDADLAHSGGVTIEMLLVLFETN